MPVGIIGRKCGMTRLMNQNGVAVPVTVIHVDNNQVVQLKTAETDGYNSVQVKSGAKKPNKVVKALLDQYVQVFFNTDPSQNDERSIAYYSARSIQEVINTLNQQVLMKNQILKKNEE